MNITIRKDDGIKGKVRVNSIHGKFPYKIYLQMLGNKLYGDYIGVISNEPIKPENTVIDSVVIQLKDKLADQSKQNIAQGVQGFRPNSIDGSAVRYKVKEVNVLDIGSVPIVVYRPVKVESGA